MSGVFINDSKLWSYLAKQRPWAGQLGACPDAPDAAALVQAVLEDCKVETWYRGLATVLTRMVGASLRIDWLLHLTQKRYRDHTAHPRSVAMVGDYLLDIHITEDRPLREYPLCCDATKIKTPFSASKEVTVAWWIAALLHDHAYPLAHMFRWFPDVGIPGGPPPPGQTEMADLLGRVYGGLYSNKPEFENIWQQGAGPKRSDLARAALNAYLVDLEYLAEEEIAEITKGEVGLYDHGIWSAANLAAKLLEAPTNFDPTIPTTGASNAHKAHRAIRAAVRAIAFHSARCRIAVWQEPIAFLLILCDTVQEWGRRVFDCDDRPESDAIEMRGIEETKTTEGTLERFFEESLEIEFMYERDRIRLSGWNDDKFREGKHADLSRLQVPSKNFRPQKIRYHVAVPDDIDMARHAQ